MIRNNDILDVIKIKNYMYGQFLSSNVLHNSNFNEITIFFFIYLLNFLYVFITNTLIDRGNLNKNNSDFVKI